MKNIEGMFLDNGFDGIIVLVDDKFSIIDVNTQFEELLGYDKETVQNSMFTDYLLPDEKPFFFELIYSQTDMNFKTFRMYHSSGAFRYFSISIFRFKEVRMIFGKTVKKEFASYNYFKQDFNQKKLRDQNNSIENMFGVKLDSLLNNESETITCLLDILPFDLWVKDSYGRYMFVNKMFEKSTGLRRKDILKKDDYAIFDKKTAKNFVDSDYIVIESKKPLQYLFEAKESNLPLYTMVTKMPLLNTNKEHIGLLSFALDVTETKEIQLQKENELNHINKMLRNFNGIIFETDFIGNTYYINGSLVNNLLQKDLTKINMYEIFEIIGVTVKSIKDANRVLVHRETKVLHLNNGIALEVSVFPFDANDENPHLLGVGRVIENETEQNN